MKTSLIIALFGSLFSIAHAGIITCSGKVIRLSAYTPIPERRNVSVVLETEDQRSGNITINTGADAEPLNYQGELILDGSKPMELLLDAYWNDRAFITIKEENNVMKFSLKFVDRFEMTMFHYITTKLKCQN